MDEKNPYQTIRDIVSVFLHIVSLKYIFNLTDLAFSFSFFFIESQVPLFSKNKSNRKVEGINMFNSRLKLEHFPGIVYFFEEHFIKMTEFILGDKERVSLGYFFIGFQSSFEGKS